MKVILSIILIASMALCSCQNKPGSDNGLIGTETVENNASATGDEDAITMPVISFDKYEHDFGRLVDGEKVEYSFNFTNTGDGDLVISSCYGSCGCTVAEWPKDAVAPGDGGQIKVYFDSKKRPGINNKTVTVLANTNPRTTVLRISAEVAKKNN